MEVLFHKPKCKGVADNEIMFAHLWQLACEVISGFYIIGLERLLAGREHVSRFTIRCYQLVSLGWVFELSQHKGKTEQGVLMLSSAPRKGDCKSCC